MAEADLSRLVLLFIISAFAISCVALIAGFIVWMFPDTKKRRGVAVRDKKDA